jgi:LacI family transcriptional regulator
MGYKEALKKRSIEFDEKLVILSGLGNSADAQLIELLEHYHIDGVFAHSDYHSFQAMEILLKNGFKIPGDVQVIGYADEPLASYTTPKITTIKQPAFEIGRVGMELLLQEIESGTKGEPKILGYKIGDPG